MCSLLFFIVLPFFFKSFFNNENWTIGKNIFFYFFLVLSINFFNYLYNYSVQITENSEVLSLKDFFTYTFSLAVFPIVFSTYIIEVSYKLQRLKISKEIMKIKDLDKKIVEENITNNVKVFGENNKENISFNINDLIYITSNGNYASFFIKTTNGTKEKLLRITLTRVFNSLNKYSNIIRCHKSYIINNQFIKSINGNARGYYLKSDYIQKTIPVSRNFKKDDLKNLIS
jgi:hypothetical protein